LTSHNRAKNCAVAGDHFPYRFLGRLTGTSAGPRLRSPTSDLARIHLPQFLSKVRALHEMPRRLSEYVVSQIEREDPLSSLEIADKRADELRKQAELLNLAHDAIVLRDLNGAIRFWNSGGEEMYGYTSQHATGRNTESHPGEPL
jgi:PAS domain-containing protein